MSIMRKDPLCNGKIYHIVNRSIAGYLIFNSKADYLRFTDSINFYQYKIPYKLSEFKDLTLNNQKEIFNRFSSNPNNQIVQLVAYCIMPTHIHLILKQLCDNGISNYMNKLLNSYSRYFNTKHVRKGPLWQSRFKSILIDSDELLLHITRYNHLNPTSAGLVENPKDWAYSSYNEYINNIKTKICKFKDVIDINPNEYKQFVNDRIGYQKEISKIKALLLEDHTG